MAYLQYFPISCMVGTKDYYSLVSVVNQGIDARLTGFTQSKFDVSNNRLYCEFHIDELEILIRRLVESGDNNSNMLADDIVYSQFGYSV